MAKYRGEKWEVTYGIEPDGSYGLAPAAGLTALFQFGVFQEATLPNPRWENQFIWAMNPTARNYFIGYKGKAVSNGNIGNIIVLDGTALALPLSNDIAHSSLGGGVYQHLINETIKLPSFRVVATNIGDTEPAPPDTLVRWFVGGKVNTATYRCDEGNILSMDLGMIFKMPYFTATAPSSSSIAPWYDADAVRQTGLTNTCSEPYYFSQGVITMKVPYLGGASAVIATVKQFKLDVSNNLDPKYYITTGVEKVPYEIWEGKREYTLTLTVDLVDNDGWKKDSPLLELLNQGMNGGAFTGAAFDIKFSRSANDYIEFITPASGTATCGGNNQGSLLMSAPMPVGGTGIITTTMEFKSRTLLIKVVDGLASTAYPIA